MAKDRQTSWAAGELAPELQGQSGTAEYRAGAALLKNYLVTPRRTLINRSGSVHLATLGSSTARLVPFLFAGDEPRLLQLYGTTEVGVAIRGPDGNYAGAGPLEPFNDTIGDSVAPSREAVLERLRRVRIAQAAGTAIFTRPGSATGLIGRIIRVDASHYGVGGFSTSRLAFGTSVAGGSNAAVQTTDPAITIKALVGDGTHPKREWDYLVTRVISYGSGSPDKPNMVVETVPKSGSIQYLGDRTLFVPTRETYTTDTVAGTYNPSGLPLEFAVYGDWPQRLDVSGVAGDSWYDFPFPGATSGTIIAHRVYRGRGGVYGYVGETTTRYFSDDGRDPDIANPPPAGTDPFARPAAVIDMPTAVAFKDDRLFFAGSRLYPQNIWGSAVSNWADFDEVITPDDADAMWFALAAMQHAEIRHLLDASALLAFTEKSAFALTGSGDLVVMTPTSIAARKVLSVGAAHYPPPIDADNGDIFFIEAKGGHPYAVKADGNGAVELTDLAEYSPHLFENHTIVDWAWANDPHKTLWAVRDDGVLLSLCYSPGTGVRAWTQHAITGGIVESVATLPIGREDLLYMVVRRGDDLMLERLAPRIINDQRYACHLDCATISDLTRAFVLTVDSVSGGSGDPYELELTVDVAAGLVPGDAILFPDTNGYLVQATVDAVAGADVDVTVTGHSGDTLQVVAGHSVSAGQWGIDDNTIPANGLADGTVVTAVLDGAVFPGLVVGADVTGQVTPPIPCLVRIVGLPFKSQFQTLPVGAEQDQAKQKAMSHIRVKLGRSRGGAVGADFDHLKEIPPRLVSDGYGVIAPRPETAKVPVDSKFLESAVAVVEQSQPKPISILSVEPEYSVGG